jgi:REP element-mobilizing transposase RayT
MQPPLDLSLRPRMHAYLATIFRDLGAELAHVGGVADHLHIVTTLPLTLSQAQLIEQIKKHRRFGSKHLILGISAFSGSAATVRFR